MTTMAMRTTKAIGFISKQIALHVHHIFWYLFIDVHGSKITKKRNPKRLPFVWKNPEIPGRIFKWNDSSWKKYSGKKVIPFNVLPFSRFYRNDRNFLYHLSGLLVPGFMSREREKFTGML